MRPLSGVPPVHWVAGDHLQSARATHYLLPLVPPLLPAGKLRGDPTT